MLSDWLVPGKIEKLLGVAGVAEPDSDSFVSHNIDNQWYSPVSMSLLKQK